ncbi:MAG TPA: hypothetical protein VK387_05115 [Thermoleophilaceae bacterium]|nr:hypothetical protein [Thermoleophilaceae bacterium]
MRLSVEAQPTDAPVLPTRLCPLLVNPPARSRSRSALLRAMIVLAKLVEPSEWVKTPPPAPPVPDAPAVLDATVVLDMVTVPPRL